jgi:hypothetical protein
MSIVERIEIIAHYPHDDSMRAATLNGRDVAGVLRTELNVGRDGGWITVLAGGVEYPVAGWVAYVSGVADTCCPLEVTA